MLNGSFLIKSGIFNIRSTIVNIYLPSGDVPLSG